MQGEGSQKREQLVQKLNKETQAALDEMRDNILEECNLMFEARCRAQTVDQFIAFLKIAAHTDWTAYRVLDSKTHLAKRRKVAAQPLNKETQAALEKMRKKMREDCNLMFEARRRAQGLHQFIVFLKTAAATDWRAYRVLDFKTHLAKGEKKLTKGKQGNTGSAGGNAEENTRGL
jgi:hypothetical protein